jgi:hypothetical protein
MNRRGHALPLLMTVLAALAISGAVLGMRLSSNTHARRSDDVRLQALWLARSALSAEVTGERRVDTPFGPALVHAGRGSVLVDLQGASATITSEPYVERFLASSPP